MKKTVRVQLGQLSRRPKRLCQETGNLLKVIPYNTNGDLLPSAQILRTGEHFIAPLTRNLGNSVGQLGAPAVLLNSADDKPT